MYINVRLPLENCVTVAGICANTAASPLEHVHMDVLLIGSTV